MPQQTGAAPRPPGNAGVSGRARQRDEDRTGAGGSGEASICAKTHSTIQFSAPSRLQLTLPFRALPDRQIAWWMGSVTPSDAFYSQAGLGLLAFAAVMTAAAYISGHAGTLQGGGWLAGCAPALLCSLLAAGAAFRLTVLGCGLQINSSTFPPTTRPDLSPKRGRHLLMGWRFPGGSLGGDGSEGLNTKIEGVGEWEEGQVCLRGKV
jgi:hypothetical protein